MLPFISQKNICILYNSLAGAGRADIYAEKIKNELANRNINFKLFKNKWPASLDIYSDAFIVGGDGTLNFFVNQYPGIILPLFIFNAGTGNDFHWMLYDHKTFDEQMEIALAAAPGPIDVGTCNGRYFINGIGVGFEGEVVKALTGKKKKPGKTSFLLCILKKIFTYRSGNYSIKTGADLFTGKKLLVDISNGCRAGGGFQIAPEAKADDGLFDIIMAESMSPFKRLLYLPVIEKGKHLHLSVIKHVRANNVSVESDSFIQYHMDGEYFEANKINIAMCANKLYFRY